MNNTNMFTHNVIKYFASGASLRLSLTNLCNRSCWFCHSEAHDNIEKQSSLLSEQWKLKFAAMIESFSELGARKYYLTGGEPTLRTDLAELVDIILHASHDNRITLASNGAFISERLSEIGKNKLTKIKLSVHGFESSIDNIGIRIWSRDELIKCTKICGEYAPVEYNIVATRSSLDSILPILNLAAEIGVNAQVLELIWTPQLDQQYLRMRIPIKNVQKFLLDNGALEDKSRMSLISGWITSLRWKNIRVKLFEPEKGIFLGSTCMDCIFRKKCLEGLFSVRLDTQFIAEACLLRRDLSRSFDSYLESDEGFKESFIEWYGQILGSSAFQSESIKSD